MNVEEPTGTCVVCREVDAERGLVCERDRPRQHQLVWELRDLHDLLPHALEPGRGARERRAPVVEAGLPLRVDAVDLAARASTATVRDLLVPRYRLVPSEERDWDLVSYMGQMRRQRAVERVPVLDGNGEQFLAGAGDQDGVVSVASVLDVWAQRWAGMRDDEELPDATVPALVPWLTRRLDWAMEKEPQYGAFSRELTVTVYVVRTVISVSRQPIYSPLACPRCKTAALRRQSGDKVWRCGECREEVVVEHPVGCECGCEPKESAA